MPHKKIQPGDFSRNLSQTGRQTRVRRMLSIDKLVQDVIASNQAEFFEQNIVVETDLSSVNAVGDMDLIKSAFASLIGNAKELMKSGGELTVTLVDGNHQWELEVADSVDEAFAEKRKRAPQSNEESELPHVIPFPQTDHLRKAYRAALSHGGHVQSWDCPQGGTAYVLVIPKPPRQFQG